MCCVITNVISTGVGLDWKSGPCYGQKMKLHSKCKENAKRPQRSLFPRVKVIICHLLDTI